MAEPAKGLFYAPSPAPQSGELAAMRQWMDRELGRIAMAMKEGRAQSLRLDELSALPERSFTGMVAFFRGGVAGLRRDL